MMVWQMVSHLSLVLYQKDFLTVLPEPFQPTIKVSGALNRITSPWDGPNERMLHLSEGVKQRRHGLRLAPRSACGQFWTCCRLRCPPRALS